MSFLLEIAAELEEQDIALPPPDGGLLIGEYNETADDLVVLYETGPAGIGGRIHNTPGINIVDQGGQVVTRGNTYAAAEARAKELWTFFNGTIQNQTLSGTRYLTLETLGPPSFFQRDGQNRFLFVFNFRALKEPS